MNKGMTLIELLVVIAMILIMTGVVLTTDPRPSVELDQAARQLVADLRHAQNMAMSVEEHSGTVPYRYGIYFVTTNKNRYVLFADKDNDKIYDGAEERVGADYIYLPSRVQISNPSNFYVFFEAPSGATTISSNPFNINFQLSSATKQVSITSTGIIQIQ